MLQQPAPEDFVLATGETHPVREFVERSFELVGIKLQCVHVAPCPRPHETLTPPRRWRNEGINEEGLDTKTGKVVVKVDAKYFRPAEVEYVAHSPVSKRTDY